MIFQGSLRFWSVKNLAYKIHKCKSKNWNTFFHCFSFMVLPRKHSLLIMENAHDLTSTDTLIYLIVILVLITVLNL